MPRSDRSSRPVARAADPTDPSPGGRRRLTADPDTLQRLTELGEAQFTAAEAALALGVPEVNLTRLLARNAAARRAFQAGRMRSLEALRRAQFELARTNAAMAMFLGRLYLGQGDPKEAGDGEAFDLSGAVQRLRDKVAAVAAQPAPARDRPGD